MDRMDGAQAQKADAGKPAKEKGAARRPAKGSSPPVPGDQLAPGNAGGAPAHADGTAAQPGGSGDHARDGASPPPNMAGAPPAPAEIGGAGGGSPKTLPPASELLADFVEKLVTAPYTPPPPPKTWDFDSMNAEGAAHYLGIEPLTVLDFRVLEAEVVVVTIDGRKLRKAR